MSRLKYFIKNRLNGKNSFFILICLFSLLLVVLGTSFAIFTYTSNKSGVLNIETGTLVSSMTSDDLINNRITVPAGTTKSFSIALKNTNSMPAKLNLYYQGDPIIAEGVEIGYDETADTAPTKIGSILNVGETRNIKVIIKNKSTSNQTIIFGTDAGLQSQTLHFPSGYFSLTALQGCTDNGLNASAPVMSANLIPIKYDGTQWVKADINNTDNDWYDYETQMWANAVTVTEATRATYQSAVIGTPVVEIDILTYLVWVPRYSYAIDSAYIGLASSDVKRLTPPELCVNFERKTTPKSTGLAPNDDFYTHPAFTFGTTELDGIWVGKFEMTETATTLTIKPNSVSVRSQNVSNMFNKTIALKNASNIYGYPTSGVDTHMMKNSEWGAVAYLSQSKYGKYGNANYSGINKEIYINPSSGYITGRSGTTVSQGSTADIIDAASSNLYGYDGSNCSTKTEFVCTGIKHATLGSAASTTGTIYGIYDMSGGSYEFIMGNLNNTAGSSGFSASWFTTPSNAKYYDKYTQTTSLLTYNDGLKGDALYETQSWYNDNAGFASAPGPWFVRGGGYNNTANAGVFYSYSDGGYAINYYSWRFVQTE